MPNKDTLSAVSSRAPEEGAPVIEIVVQDDGPGFSPDASKRTKNIFLFFFDNYLRYLLLVGIKPFLNFNFFCLFVCLFSFLL